MKQDAVRIDDKAVQGRAKERKCPGQTPSAATERRRVKRLGATLTALRLFPDRESPLIRETLRGYVARGKEARSHGEQRPSRGREARGSAMTAATVHPA